MSSIGTARSLLRAGFEQRHRLLVLHTPLGADRLLAETLRGWETIDGGGFRFELTALSDDAHIPLKSLIGQAVRLDLQTQQSRSELRPIHGHVTQMELVASNGGLARYRLVIEPWLALLRWRVDSYLFQDRNIIDLIDSVLGDWRGQGKLEPRWRWDILERERYPRRSITCQYRESDLAFMERLLAEEGLFYWFEHQKSQGQENAGLGAHTLVIADHNGAFQPNAQDSIRYHRADATESQDSIQQWNARRQLHTNSLSARSWDYKSLDTRAVTGQGAAAAGQRPLHWMDDPGAYAWEDRAQGERLLANAIAALELRDKCFEGQSTVRTLAPASTFTLTGHHAHETDNDQDRRFVVLRVRHQARNNLDEKLQNALHHSLGPAAGFATAASQRSDWRRDPNPGQANAQTETPHYRNHFVAVRAAIAYRPLSRDGHGRAIHPKPTVHGQQSALVIGVQDSPIHTERDHRVKVQFHWQRGANASARAEHPAGENNAPADDQLGAWLRVANAAAGDNWGQVSLPRVGQEVLVAFHHGDIDRPVIVAGLYNGAGAQDAPHNRQGSGAAGATGNAPAWFAGEQGEHGHNAVYSGLKSQQLDTSQSGGGGYNQLVFDDTPGQPRLGLASTQAASRVHLGLLRNQDDNQRQSERGHGAELASQAHGALRGGAGVLISAHTQQNAQGPFLDSRSAQSETQRARELTHSLIQSAQTQKAQLKDEAAPDQLPIVQDLAHIAQVLGSTEQGSDSAGTDTDTSPNTPIQATGGGGGSVIAYSEPHLQLSAPMGIGAATPKQAVFVSGSTSALVAQEDLGLQAQGQIAIAVAKGASLYTLGAQPETAQEPNLERGIALHAATGAVKVQSQSGKSALAAEQQVTIASTQSQVNLLAPEQVLLTVGGAYVKLSGSTIQVHAPGKVTFWGGRHVFTGPGSDRGQGGVGKADLKGCSPSVQNAAAQQGALVALW